MKNLHTLDKFRLDEASLYGCKGNDTHGAFEIPSKIDGRPIRVIASGSGGWDHVSVSRRNRCPNWDEMEQIKRLFFEDHECAMQLHVPVAEHLSVHPYCLHMWRPHHVAIPMPPACFVAPAGMEEVAM
jgi:hypothetical protein